MKKALLVGAVFAISTSLGQDQTIDGSLTVTNSIYFGNGSMLRNGDCLSLGGNSSVPGQGTPFIDFRNSFTPKSTIWNTRLINDADGQLHFKGKKFLVDGQLLGNSLSANTLLINDPNIPENWDDIWQSGFFSGRDLPSAPESGHVFWGLSMGHWNNYSYGQATGNKNGAQIVIRNSPSFPTMYIRSRFDDGTGVWGKVLSSDKNGRYGIGTDKPNTALTISGSGYPNSFVSMVGTNNNNAGLRLYNGDSVKWHIYNRADKDNALQIRSSNTLGIEIGQSGNVGIGYARPQFKLYNTGNIGFGEGNRIWSIGAGRTNGEQYTANDVFYQGTVIPGSFAIRDNWKNKDMFFISAYGDVGIGTQKTTGFKLSVAGKIRAEGIKVDKGWADYVFEDNYTLLTLSQVKDSIELNGHLPGMKSAEEVAASGGFEIGETTVKLLEKIEELTLYSIDLHSENNTLKQQNEHLTSTVSELTEKVAQFDDLKNRIDALEHSLNTENNKLK